MSDSIARFLKSSDFYKGFVLALSILIVLGLSSWLGYFDTGLSLIMGMFICAPANVPGSNRHRIIGILTATILGMLATTIINVAALHFWLLIPVLCILIFGIAYLSVYGFRASLVSFAGLLAIILSFAHPQTGSDIFIHAALIGLGGLWYLLFAHLSHLLIHKKHTEQLMAECMELTAKYLHTRGELILKNDNLKELQSQLFNLQTDINGKHETLREILLSSRQNSGYSNFSRRQVLIFIELIDILELAIANLANFHKIHQRFKKHPQKIQPFIDLIFEMAGQLHHLAKVMGDNKTFSPNKSIDNLLIKVEKNIATYSAQARSEEASEGILLLQNTHHYIQKQAQKISLIEKVMNNLIEKDQMRPQRDSEKKFITQQDYDLKTFTENLSFKSPIFKHSLRLTLTVLVGFAIGMIFPVQNSYWILLTIIVIMRPGYGLTKQRSKHRIYGTLIGGAIAIAVVFLTQNIYIYAVLAIITFILAFSLIQKNYKSSAIFITLNIVFVYSLAQPNPLEVIQFRVVDTLTGATLAIIANIFFWPSWEFQNIQKFVADTISANRLYLKEIDNYYHHKNNADPAYKLSRKGAFLAIGNLNAAFQRMTQEPKSRQKNLANVYEVVVLNNTLLSLAASLGTFIRHHKTTAASRHFEIYMGYISQNLERAGELIRHKNFSEENPPTGVNEAREYLDNKYRELAEQPIDTKEGNEELQEVQLISDQLKWLHTISENLKKIAPSL